MADNDDADMTIPQETLHRVRNRALQAEKEKLNLANPINVVNNIEEIVREEIS
jgi:hypothetical protein